MPARKTGTSMGGRIEYTRKVQPIPCHCPGCYHARTLNGRLFCSWYNRYDPARKTCPRFEHIPGKLLGQKGKKKKRRAKKNTSAGR